MTVGQRQRSRRPPRALAAVVCRVVLAVVALPAAGAGTLAAARTVAPRGARGTEGARGGWSKALTIDHTRSGNGLNGVSCPSTHFCMAVDAYGNDLVYNGSTWSAPEPATPGNSAFNVSCASSTFCVVTGTSGFSIYNGSSWTPPRYLGSNDDISLGAVSCVSATFCAAVTQAAGANGLPVQGISTYNGRGWSAADNIGLGASLRADVSCTSASFCVAVGNTGNFPGAVSIFNGKSWSRPEVLNPREHPKAGGPLVDVSCGSRTLCLADDSNPYAEHTFRYNGHRWSRPQVIGTLQTFIQTFNFHLSCAGSRFCMATTYSSTARSFNGRSWSPATTKQVMHTQINSLSCATPSFCVAVGDFGEAAFYRR